MKRIILLCMISIGLLHAKSEHEIKIENLNAKMWESETHCRIKEKNVEICRLVEFGIKSAIAQAKLEQSKGNKKAAKVYAERLKNDFLQICLSHSMLNADEREFLEGLNLRYNNARIYNEVTFEEICKPQNLKDVFDNVDKSIQ